MKCNNSFKASKFIVKMPEIDLFGNSATNLYKNAIESAINTYSLPWKVIFETLQNSIDSIDKNEKISEGQIYITLDIDKNEVVIKDNGVGFPLKNDLFHLYGGTKIEEKKLKGKIGVGLKVVIFSSKSFYVNSVYKNGDGKNKSWTGTIVDAYKYKEKSSLSGQVSALQETKSLTGTTISYTFPDNSVLDFIKTATKDSQKILDVIAKSQLEKFKRAIEYFFRTNSYSADTIRLIDETKAKKINIDIKIKYSNIPSGLEENLTNLLKDANGEIDLSFQNKFWDIEEIIKKQKGINKPNIINHKFYDKEVNLGKFNPDLIFWVKRFTDKDEIKELLTKRHKDNFDDLIPKINGIYLALANSTNMKKFYFQLPNTFISINGVPSDHLLPNPISNTAYAKLVLCIIDIDETFNYGKLQTTNRVLIGKCHEFYQQIYNNVIAKIGEKAFGKDMDENTSGSSVEKQTIITDLPDLGLPISFKKIPFDENSLIALFFELLGKGQIKDYNFYSLHTKQKYDAKAMFKTEKMSSIPSPNNDDDLKNIEFKLRLSQVLDDIDSGTKDFLEMDFIIVWEDDLSGLTNNPYDYEVISLEDSKDKDKGFFGVKKVLWNKNNRNERQIFVMKDFIEELKKS